MTNPIEEAANILGGYEAAGRVCGVSGKAVRKWALRGRLPRTEATGETHYAQLMAEADERISARRLLATVMRPDQEAAV